MEGTKNKVKRKKSFKEGKERNTEIIAKRERMDRKKSIKRESKKER